MHVFARCVKKTEGKCKNTFDMQWQFVFAKALQISTSLHAHSHMYKHIYAFASVCTR